MLGRDHPDTLGTRHNIAGWTGEVGDAAGALRLFTELLPDMERVLGRDHPNTLRTQEAIKLLESAASLSQDERIERSGSLVWRLMSCGSASDDGSSGAHATPIGHGWSARTCPIGRPTSTLPR